MKRFLYSLKNLRFDILTSLSTIALTFIGLLLWQNQLNLFVASVFVTIIFLIFVIYFRVKEKDFYFIPLTRREDKDDWIGNGTFEYSRPHGCFRITNADPGYIYSKCLTWSDYEFGFDFKIMKAVLGVIVRAVNLSNYVMLQITLKGIRPHVRINGGWSVWEAQSEGLDFANKALDIDKWYKCLISCDKGSICIRLKNENNVKIFDRKWDIISGYIAIDFNSEGESTKPTKVLFPVNLEYGSFGFRNCNGEEALIKNVLSEKI